MWREFMILINSLVSESGLTSEYNPLGHWSFGPQVVYLLDLVVVDRVRYGHTLSCSFLHRGTSILLLLASLLCSMWMLWDSFSSTGKNSCSYNGGLDLRYWLGVWNLRGADAHTMFSLVVFDFSRRKLVTFVRRSFYTYCCEILILPGFFYGKLIVDYD